MAILTVVDTGAGIPDDVAKKMFTPFYTTKISGNGLGLAICKQVVEAHNGSIEFDSESGRGTIFTITLPMKGIDSRKEDPESLMTLSAY